MGRIGRRSFALALLGSLALGSGALALEEASLPGADEPVIEPAPSKLFSAPAERPERQRVRTQPGQELATEPLTQGEAEAEATAAPSSQPTPRPAVDRKQVKRYGWVPDPQQPQPVAGEGDEGGELVTEPLRAPKPESLGQGLRSFRAELDRSHAHLDESFTLTVETTVADLNGVSPVHLPSLPQFDLINQYKSEMLSNSDGRTWRIRTQQFVFLAREPGAYTLPSFDLSYRGQTYHTASLKIEIEGTRTGYAYHNPFTARGKPPGAFMPAAPETESERGGASEFTAGLSAPKAYVNQQVTLIVRLKYKQTANTTLTYTPPDLSGYLLQELPPRKKEESVSGSDERYLDITYRTALFPIQEGPLPIGPARAVISRETKEEVLSTETQTFTALPLPEDPNPIGPERANGLVGQFTLTARLEPSDPQVGTPARVELTLNGSGNLAGAATPFFELVPGLRLFLERREDRPRVEEEQVAGTRFYSYLAVFDQPGKFKPGQAALRFFQPELGRWFTALALLPEVEVRPAEVQSAEAAGLLPRSVQLKPNHAGHDPLRLMGTRVIDAPGFWLLQALGPVLIAFFWWLRVGRRRSQADASLLRMRHAYPVARRSLDALQRCIRTGEARAFYDGLTRTTTEYLAAKFNLPAAYIGGERLPEQFNRYHIPEALCNRFKAALTACEYVRYAAVMLPERDMRSLHRDLKLAILSFEDHWWREHRRRRRQGTALVALLLSLLAGQAFAGEAEMHFLKGNEWAGKQQPIQAETEYRQVFDSRVEDADVYFNLGNVYLLQQKLGPAILTYERGRLLSPRDGDLQYNLAQAVGLTALDESATPERLGDVGLPWLFRQFTPNELAGAASVVYFLAIGVFLLPWIRPGWPRPWRWLLWGLAGCWLLLTLWSAARYLEPYWWRRGVVMTEQAKVYLRPYSQAEMVTVLHAGSRVVLGQEEEAWVEVVFGAQQRGWVERNLIGVIE